ncbi:MAG: chromosome segregation protein [Maribacter sp.]|nr:MAG: chromosome segregation protein [Maribacter sp.]
MQEEKDQELQKTVGGEKNSETTEASEHTLEKSPESTIRTPKSVDSLEPKKSEQPKDPMDLEPTKEETDSEKDNALNETEESNTEDAGPTKQSTDSEPAEEETDNKNDDALNEIEESNAEDAEDQDNHHRHNIPLLDYHAMSMENLVGELQRLVKNEKIQAIKKHVDRIKHEFDLKFQEFIEQKKEDFVNNGGNELDFRYNSVSKRQFNEVYSEYREKRNQYYKNLENSLKDNMTNRLAIIEELKSLVNVEEDINTTYKHFKEVQEKWRSAGPVPRNKYNDIWRTYHHHIEIFYDFLHINRELRDLDFKHNLDEKTKLVERAEALGKEEDLNKAFRELQTLHKIWKEDIGPVDKEHREEIWERFGNATKVLHQRRQEHYKELDKVYGQNLEKKKGIINAIKDISGNIANNHKALQQQIKKIEELRDDFFKAGRVPQKVNEHTWAEFKEAVRGFNRNKNAYYKNLKKDQQENLEKKRELLDLAISLKDSEEWDTTTSEMKRIQNEWKKIGHVPRKYSDKIWKEFKDACNHYFDRLHKSKNASHKDEVENYEKKDACLKRLKSFELTGQRDTDLAAIKSFIEEWKTYGRVPFNKKNINQKFNKILDAIFKKLDVGRQESELLKYGNKIQQLANADDDRAIVNERLFIRKKIDESKNEIRQLENNLQFFSNASEDNPLVRDVIKKVEKQKKTLETWMAKLKKLNIMQHNLEKEDIVDEATNPTQKEE